MKIKFSKLSKLLQLPRHSRIQLFAGAVIAQSTVLLNPTAQSVPFEGWGTSLYGEGHIISKYSKEVQKKYYDVLFSPTLGLGLNVVRYFIPGGENPDPTHVPGRTTPHYSRPPESFQPEPGVWKWSADLKQRLLLKEAQARGADTFEAFSNSPPYWMTESKCSAGSVTGSSNNLQTTYYDLFADYLTEVVKFFRDDPGLKITFRTLDPLNEPSGTWWKRGGGQEGCHFSTSAQGKIISAVGKSLIAKGLVGTTISASDENSLGQAAYQAKMYSPTNWGFISQVNFHAYNENTYAELDKVVAGHPGKRLWMSEFGSTNASPLPDRIHKVFNQQPHASAFLVWQPTWGILRVDGSGISRWRQYFFFQQYTRFIRPGSHFIQSSDLNVLASISKASDQLVLVIKNTQFNSTHFVINLANLPIAARSASAYRTSISERMVSIAAIPISPTDLLSIKAAPDSVTTLVVPLK